MKKTKILIPILGLSSVVGVVTPLITSCNMKESENVTISFYALEGGSVSAKSIDAKVGDKWGDLKLPEATAAYEYVFMGWFNGNRAMRNSDIISSDMTITARFGYNPSKVWYESDLQKSGFYGSLQGDVYQITQIPDSPSVIIPSRVYVDGRERKIGICSFNMEYGDVQSIYFPKTITEISVRPSRCLTNVIVDPENTVYTSRTKSGVECNCAILKETEDADAAVLLGCANSVIPTDLNIKQIRQDAFRYFDGETIVLPDTLELIGNNAFRNSSIKTITIPKKVKSIGESAFEYNRKLEDLIMLGEKPADVDPIYLNIGESAFYGCRSLKNVTWAKNIYSIDDEAFRYCESLESISIPACTDDISLNAFRDCPSLSSIVVDSNNEYYKSENGNCIMEEWGSDDWRLIIGCKTTTIPAICTGIANYAFYDCDGLTEITIPNKVKSIGDYAFQGCENLASIVIPTNVTGIGQYAFAGCSKLAQITLNEGIISIGQYAFANCTKVDSITIPSTVTTIGSYVFEYCTSLKTANIKSTIIGFEAFYECANLEKVTFTDTLTEISGYAFQGCLSLSEITIPKSVTIIQPSAFSGSALASITFEERTEDLEFANYAFQSCRSLRSITIPKQLTKVGQFAFDSCNFKNETIFFAGTHDEFMSLAENWNHSWYKDESGSATNAVQKIECLNETEAAKKIIDVNDLYA